MSQVHLEGRISVVAALESRARRIDVVLLKHDLPGEKSAEILDAAERVGVPVRRVDGRELDSLVHGKSHGGVVAVCSTKPRLSENQLLEIVSQRSNPLLLLLEGVDDARNLGFVCRTAHAMDATAVLIKKHLWDFDDADVSRSSSGAYERLNVAQFEGVDLLERLRARGLSLVGCLANVRSTIYDIDLRRPTILALGGEKRGLSGAVRNICDSFVTIPTAAQASSLSLSHAAAIVLGESHRQRRPQGVSAIDTEKL